MYPYQRGYVKELLEIAMDEFLPVKAAFAGVVRLSRTG
jgi:hypothetical protein